MMLPEANLYVDGALRRAAGNKTYDDIGPWTGDVVGISGQEWFVGRAPWWLFGLLLLNFALMTYDARDDSTKQRKIRSITQAVTYPIQQGASSVGNWIGGLFGNIGELRRASTENQELHKQIDQMQAELRDTRERAAEASGSS